MNLPQEDCVHVIVMNPMREAPVEDTLCVGVVLHRQRGSRPDTAHLEGRLKAIDPGTTLDDTHLMWRMSSPEGTTPSRNRVPVGVNCVAAMILHPSWGGV